MSPPEFADGLTVKELLLRLDAKLDSYMHSHDRHHNEQLIPRGVLLTEFEDADKELAKLAKVVESHERTIQRIIGALVLLSAIGFGTLLTLFLRLSGAFGSL